MCPPFRIAHFRVLFFFASLNSTIFPSLIYFNSLCSLFMETVRLIFEITIPALCSIVWEKLWGAESYSLWTASFCEGSYYSGELLEGNRVHLLTPEGHGMYSNVFKRIENSTFIFEHLGEMVDFKEVLNSDNSNLWSGAFEEYHLTEVNSQTHLRVEVDTLPPYADFMNTTFPKALEALKTISTN